MSETNEEKLYRIAFGYNVKNHHHARQEFNDYIKKYYPDLVETLKMFWQKRFLYVNGWMEICVTGKLVDYISKRCI